MTNRKKMILAFDSTCATCSEVANAVYQASDGKLDVLPLAEPSVVAYQARALGSEAASEPILIQVSGDTVRTWTGWSMVGPLLRQLGANGAFRVTRALGSLRRRAAGRASELPGWRPTGLEFGRTEFLRLGAGAILAAGLLGVGAAPALADEELESAEAWVHANRANLPVAYDDVCAYSGAYRRAIFVGMSPSQRSELWVQRIERYRAGCSNDDAEYSAFFDLATATAADEEIFARLGAELTAAPRERLRLVRDAAIATLGPTEAALLLTDLGPQPLAAERTNASGASARPPCSCSTADSYCNIANCRASNKCRRTDGGCGTFYQFDCNGGCPGGG